MVQESKIKSIEIVDEKVDYVYDIQVEDNHNFFADDVLVHNCIVLDECHRTSDFVIKEKLVPMLGSFSVAKTIKIGISLYKNNFWHSCNDNGTKYKVLRKPWSECDIYWLQGSIKYEGREYPKRIVDLMPKSVKEKLFPNDLNLHYDSVEGYSEIEWNTQYEMIWMEDINLVLSGEQQKKLASGLFDILLKGRPEMTERYYFGLDTASGTLMPGQKDLDWTVLTIIRKNQDNTKDIVAKYMWQGDVVNQMQEIKDLIHPLTGIFQCVMGLADYSNIAIGIVEMFKKEGIPIAGVTFGATEPITKKNYKNAMFDQFVFELDSGRVQYPNIEKIKKNKVFKDGYEQWGMVERHRKLGINDKIFVDPSQGHDDHCFVGSTKIRLLDGTTKTIKELSENLSEDTYVYSIDLNNKNAIVPGKVLKAFKTGIKQTLKITLDNNEFFECTTDHKLMLRDGSYKEAQDLVVGQSMMPLYTEKKRLFKTYDYEFVYDPSQEKYIPTHQLVAKFIPEGTGHIIHHSNFNRFDNRPNNLIHVTPKEHWQIHGDNIRSTNAKIWPTLSHDERVERTRHGREKAYENISSNTSIGKERRKQKSLSILNNPELLDKKVTILKKASLDRWAKLSKEERLKIMEPVIEAGAASLRGKPSWRKGQKNWDIRLCACGCGETFECYPSMKKNFVNLKHAAKMRKRGSEGTFLNHKIVSIEISSVQDVYDLTVDKYHNFALDCGIFVHNCSSDVLAVWCADQEKSYQGKIPRTMKGIPMPIVGPSNLSGSGIPMPGQDGNPNSGRFLKDRLT